MIENLDFLPAWITRAAVPALGVMAFFWKGDEALSEDFKKWLSQTISGVRLTVPEISSIEPLGRVFDLIYGPRYFGLVTVFRVAAISFVALIISTLVTAGGVGNAITALRATQWTHASPITLVLVNLLFDYLSITKSRLLIAWIVRSRIRHRTTVFVIADLLVTCLLVGFYFVADFFIILVGAVITYGGADDFQGARQGLGNFASFITTAFYLTTFMTLLLTVLYSISLMSFKLFGLAAKTAHIIQWMLPFQTLPVRSIGIVAGVLLFCILEIFHALAG